MSYRYVQIVEHFQQAISNGSLGVGHKLPSLRLVRERFQCALSVAQQAYGELQALGLVRGVEKSGYFVCGMPPRDLPSISRPRLPLKPFPPLTGDLVGRIMELANAPEIVPLHGAIPHDSLLPLQGLRRHMNEVHRLHPRLLAQYTPGAGSSALRQELARMMLAKGVQVRADEILVTNGCSEALRLAVDCCSQPGDAIAIETPAFFGMISMLELMGRKVVGIPVRSDTGIDLDYLSEVLKLQSIRACMVTPNFQNPLGALMPEDHKRRLCRMAQESRFLIIEDDIYGDCCHGIFAPVPLKAFDTGHRVVYCASFAKSLAPGLRLGFCIPGPLQKSMVQAKQRGTLGGPALLQEALASFLASGSYQRHLLQFRRAIAAQCKEMRELVSLFFPEGTRISQPQGGYFLWIQLPKGIQAERLFEESLQHGIGIVPGNAFSLQGSLYQDSIRISCANPVDSRIRSAIQTLGKLCVVSRASRLRDKLPIPSILK